VRLPLDEPPSPIGLPEQASKHVQARNKSGEREPVPHPTPRHCNPSCTAPSLSSTTSTTSTMASLCASSNKLALGQRVGRSSVRPAMRPLRWVRAPCTACQAAGARHTPTHWAAPLWWARVDACVRCCARPQVASGSASQLRGPGEIWLPHSCTAVHAGMVKLPWNASYLCFVM